MKLERVATTYPSGNATALVFDNVSNLERKRLNSALLDAWKKRGNAVGVEQCGAIVPPHISSSIGRVEMLGGEFCANATRSAAFLLSGGRDCEGYIEASGADKPLKFSIVNGEVTVEIPLPSHHQLATTVTEGLLVNLDGIAHMVIVQNEHSQELAHKILIALIKTNAYGLGEKPCVGVSMFDPNSKRASFSVWIKKVDTVFDETACGSGTAAIGIALSLASHEGQQLEIVQPSGEPIHVHTALQPATLALTSVYISGKVKVLYDGPLEIELK